MYNHVNEKAQALGSLQIKRNFAHVCMGFEIRDYQEPRLCTATPAARACISAAVNGQKIWSTKDYSMLEPPSPPPMGEKKATGKRASVLQCNSAH